MTPTEHREIIDSIKIVRDKIAGLPSNFWICFWLFIIVGLLMDVVNRLDKILELAK
jgi:hypothetical protein